MAGIFLYFLALMGGAARGEGLYTREDELSCGNAMVQAFTTCTEDSKEVYASVCTDQHFLFIDRATGAFVRVEGPGKPVVERDPHGRWIRVERNGLARDWACLQGRKGVYVVMMYTAWKPGKDHTANSESWEEILDLKGKRLASTKGPGWAKDKFFKTWFSLGLMPYPYPYPPFDAFSPIQLFKTERKE